jgi:PTS system glucitol/sorbitol-specific IIC component
MNGVVAVAQGFINLFQTGANVFLGWMKTIVPLVLMLIVAMNAIIALIGEKRINKFARVCVKSPLLRYMVLPALGVFLLCNPASLSLGRFFPEYYKPGYVASAMEFNHTNMGLFPHVNPGELFIFLGIANGIKTLGYSTTDLAIRYFLLGLVLNLLSGWVTDLMVKVVEKQQHVHLSKTMDIGKASAVAAGNE